VVESTHTREASKSAPSPASPPHHIELRYVFEVDAVEMPGIGIAGRAEDEPVVPFPQAIWRLATRKRCLMRRARRREVRGPEYGVRSAASFRQTRLPGWNDC